MPVAASALLALVVLAGCAKEEGGRRGGRVPIVVATVEQRAIPWELEATGTVEASQSAVITARVGGAVSRVHFREGDDVGAGQVFITLYMTPVFYTDLDELSRRFRRRRTPQLSAVPEPDAATGMFGRAAGAGLET